ncbi:MAG: glycerophosphodiester phosphodiesterase [Candidatus Nezhaarchaeales archaeon]
MRKKIVIGHRGAPSIKFENSLEGVVEALKLGVDGVEVDVRTTKEGIPIAFHDQTTSRILGIDKPVNEIGLDEIRCMGKIRGFTIPTIGGLLTVVSAETILVLDVKEWRAVEMLADLLRHLSNRKIIIASFDHRIPLTIKKAVPWVKAGLILSLRPLSLSRITCENVDCVFVKKDYIDCELLEEATSLGLDIYAWVVNDKEEAERLWSLGVCGVVTDTPQLFAIGGRRSWS